MTKPAIVKELHAHLLDVQTWYVHLRNDIWEQCNHLVVVHGHIRHNLLHCNLLCREVPILPAARLELGAELGHFALVSSAPLLGWAVAAQDVFYLTHPGKELGILPAHGDVV